jgi:hypothetical protein
VTTIRAFLSIAGGAADFKPPAPSGGKWDYEAWERMDEAEARPNEPSIFMVTESPESATGADPTSTN